MLREQKQVARDRLPPEVFAYADQGAGEELARRSARAAWDVPRLVPRSLVDVSSSTAEVQVLGQRWACPVGVAPMSMQRGAHPDGEVAMARAVAASDSTLVLSSNTGSTFADVAATGARWWLQLYASEDRSLTRDLVRRAVDAGTGAIVLTVDTPVVARKPDERVWQVASPSWVGAELPGGGTTSRDGADEPVRRKATDLGWDDVAALRAEGVPVVLKGVLHPDDAADAVSNGVSAVWVSNHGGRQLDQAVSTADALRAVSGAVRGAGIHATPGPQVFVDGGVRTPGHVLVAAALGADVVFLGRPAFWALAADPGADAPGVRRLLTAARDGVTEGLQLLGARGLAGVDERFLAPGPGVPEDAPAGTTAPL